MKFIATTTLLTALLFSVSSVDADVREREGDSKNKRPGRGAGGSTVVASHRARAEKISAHEKETATNYNPSIVDGTNAIIGQYPYYVDLGQCGGSLIARNVVLTAAQCKGVRVDGDKVVMGTIENVKKSSSEAKANTTRVLTVNKEVVHPDYDQFRSRNDISLLLLDDTYCLPDEKKFSINFNTSFPPVGEDLTVLGTGTTSFDGGESKVLQHVELDAISCSVYDGYHDHIAFKFIFESSLCARRDGRDACDGDVGGPFVKESADGSHVQVGVVSRQGCGLEQYPPVFTRVGSYTDWIKKTVCDTWGVEAPFCGNGYSKACSSSSSRCEDASDWYDSGGAEYNCKYYESKLTRCHQFGDEYSNFGKTANKACCECKRQEKINYCYSEWKDEDGYDCDWYHKDDNFDAHGWDYPNGTGVTANMACRGCK